MAKRRSPGGKEQVVEPTLKAVSYRLSAEDLEIIDHARKVYGLAKQTEALRLILRDWAASALAQQGELLGRLRGELLPATDTVELLMASRREPFDESELALLLASHGWAPAMLRNLPAVLHQLASWGRVRQISDDEWELTRRGRESAQRLSKPRRRRRR